MDVIMPVRRICSGFMHGGGKLLLSPVAQHILLRVTDGQSREQIASNLGMTRDQIDWQVRRIYRHFNVSGIARLVHAAIRQGWIEHPKVSGHPSFE